MGKTKAKKNTLNFQIESTADFFDTIIELIPSKFYLPGPDDDEKPWFHGLSKFAKASAKKQTRENLKKARKQKFDPNNTSSTLDLLQDSVKAGNEIVESDSEKVVHENRGAVTYEELRERLHKRIEELKSGRNTRVDKYDQPRFNNSNGNNHGRKRDREFVEKEEENSKRKEESVTDDVTFGRVKIGDEEKRKRKKLTKVQELEKAKKLEEMKKDPEKGKKVLWKAAESRAMGEKVHDDPKLLRESIKKDKRRQKKSAEKWKERVESRESLKKEKQKTRGDNIRERAQKKKMKKIERREKKLMRPGFEGRKEGYINE